LKSIVPIRRGGSAAAIAPTSALSIISDKLVSTGTSLPELVPCEKRRSAAWIVDHLQAFEAKSPPSPVDLDPDRIAVAAGLWQMNGFLDRSHELSQSIEGKGRNRAGDYWHAIMHRREPDYSNAKYWFRRVGQHGSILFWHATPVTSSQPVVPRMRRAGEASSLIRDGNAGIP
jgi:arylamine N-acetyltransferase